MKSTIAIISSSKNENYTNAVLKAGGNPLIISIGDSLAKLDNVDGLIIPGGKDICPKFYGQEPSALLGSTDEELDTFEFEVIKYCNSKHIPILGICRGEQILNVAFGGTLLQHIDGHRNSEESEKYHDNRIVENTFLSRIYESRIISVNSLHHQAVDKVAEGFTVSAYSEDGTIEAIENTDKKIYAVQWHPERMQDSPEQQKLFEFFIKKEV